MKSTANIANQTPIGIFDSGIGGLSVLRHIRTQLPNESLFYFADAGFAPYGDKTETEIVERTLFAAQYLLQQGVKALVVACNTATTSAIAHLRAHYPNLILVGVEPGLKPAASLTKTGCIGVLATSRTLASSKYQLLCNELQQTHHVRFINQACTGLVEQIELGEIESEITSALLNNYLQPLFAAQVDTLVLGCTHYPFLENSIHHVIQKKSQLPIQLVDTGIAIVKQLHRLLEKHQLLNQPKTNPTNPIHCFTTSGNANQLQLALARLLQLQPNNYLLQSINQKQVAIYQQAN